MTQGTLAFDEEKLTCDDYFSAKYMSLLVWPMVGFCDIFGSADSPAFSLDGQLVLFRRLDRHHGHKLEVRDAETNCVRAQFDLETEHSQHRWCSDGTGIIALQVLRGRRPPLGTVSRFSVQPRAVQRSISLTVDVESLEPYQPLKESLSCHGDYIAWLDAGAAVLSLLTATGEPTPQGAPHPPCIHQIRRLVLAPQHRRPSFRVCAQQAQW